MAHYSPRSSSRDCPCRSGLSMIELMVVIAIIGLMLALLLPAIQFTRETARSMQCRSHLRQLGTAFQSYHSDYGVFPVEMRPFVSLLPFVDQNTLHEEIESFNSSSRGRPVFGVSVYICPSDGRASASVGNTSYLVNEGYGFQTYDKNGMRLPYTYPLRYTSSRDITDGLSNTALLAERLVAFRNALATEVTAEAARFSWFVASPMLGPNQHNAFASQCLTSRTNARAGVMYPFEWLEAEHGYDHLLPPNSVGCLNTTPGVYVSFEDCTAPTSSMHRGGVNVLYADGSVHFISNVIDTKAWQRIGTRAGGETN